MFQKNKKRILLGNFIVIQMLIRNHHSLVIF